MPADPPIDVRHCRRRGRQLWGWETIPRADLAHSEEPTRAGELAAVGARLHPRLIPTPNPERTTR